MGQVAPKGEAGFGIRLAQARLRLGLTRKELGARCGHSHVMIGRWETDANSPVLENVEPLAHALGVDAVWLAFGIGE